MTMKTMPSQELQDHTFSVTELNLLAKNLLEDTLPAVWLEGEVSNLSMHSSGHWYLSLKDDESQIRAAMFKNRNQFLRFRPKNGAHVRVKGRISLYAPRGEYQFIIEHMEDAGIGALQRAFEQLKNKLNAEGLFDPARKRPLPLLPKCIGLVTSPTGAAVHDILTVLNRRFPLIDVVIYPTAVQGAEAPAQIIAAIRSANARRECEVLIVGRGGGSLEDLWAFNDETLARCIAASSIPIVSAVGHQVDFTIADFVADARAPTPSAAAELLSPDQIEWQQTLQQQERKLINAMQRWLRNASQQLTQWQSRLKHPGKRLEEQHQKLDELNTRLQNAMQRQLAQQQLALDHQQKRLSAQSPQQLISRMHTQVSHASQQLRQHMQALLFRQRTLFLTATARLETLSPLATLARGYSIAKMETGQVLLNSRQVQPGDVVTTQLAHGSVISTVTETRYVDTMSDR